MNAYETITDPEQIRKFREEFGARTSRVFKIWDWPRGVRARGWGLIHDEIWFYSEPNPANMRYEEKLKFLAVQGEHDIVEWDGKFWRQDSHGWLRLYLRRRMLWTPWGEMRLHKFFSGDDIVPHDHKWDFLTFPLQSYVEVVDVWNDSYGWIKETRVVPRFRFNFRAAEHRHYVLEPDRPFWTLILCGRDRRYPWGFWPRSDVFVPFDIWTRYD